MAVKFKRRNFTQSAGFDMTMTPLVDVLFLMQIFFLLTWGGAQAFGSRIDLSQAKTGKPLPTSAVAVAVTEESITVDGRPAELSSLASVPKDRDIIILGARKVDYQRVISVLDELRTTGHNRVALATKIMH